MEKSTVSSLINEEFIYFDYEASSFEEMIRNVSETLVEKEYVRDTYADAVIAREQVFPTGLETKCFPVGIPHTDREHVLKSVITVIRLKYPITFTAMATVDEYVKAEMIFLLAIKESEGQLTVLKDFMAVFSDDKVLNDLKDAKTKKETADILRDFMHHKAK